MDTTPSDHVILVTQDRLTYVEAFVTPATGEFRQVKVEQTNGASATDIARCYGARYVGVISPDMKEYAY